MKRISGKGLKEHPDITKQFSTPMNYILESPKHYGNLLAALKESHTPPESAQAAARKVLAWREQHPDEINGMTPVGWTRARQLASGKPISLSTVKRMAQFNRHRKNSAVAPEHKDTPWKDAGHVAWLGWGGTAGIDWAIKISART